MTDVVELVGPYRYRHGWIPLVHTGDAPESPDSRGAELPPAASDLQRAAFGRRSSGQAERVAHRSEFDEEWRSATRVDGEFSSFEQDALHNWQNGYFGDAGQEIGLYVALNDTLRGEGQIDLQSLDEDALYELDELQDHMMSAASKSRTSRDLVAFRGVTNLGDVRVGDEIRDPGWAAFSYNPSVAQAFSLDQGASSTNRVLVAHFPEGTPMLRMDDPVKHELVATPGQPMKVTRIDDNFVYVEVQP